MLVDKVSLATLGLCVLQAASTSQAPLSSQVEELRKQLSEFKVECKETFTNLNDQVLSSVVLRQHVHADLLHIITRQGLTCGVSTQMSGCADALVLTQSVVAEVVPCPAESSGVEDFDGATLLPSTDANRCELMHNCRRPARLQSCC